MARYLRASLILLPILLASASGAFAHELTVLPMMRDPDSPSPGSSLMVVTRPGDHVLLEPAAIGFGQVTEHTVATADLEVINLTAYTLTVALSSGAADVTVTPAQVTLNPAGSAGDAGTVQVQYAPTQAGILSNSLTVESMHASVGTALTDSVPLSGTAIAEPGHTERTPSAIDFGTVVVGQSVTEIVRVTNATSHTLAVNVTSGSPDVGVSPALFSLSPSGQAGNYMDIQATYEPAAAGSLSSSITVSSTHDAHTLEEPIAMTGEAAEPAQLILRQVTTGSSVSAVALGTTPAGTDWTFATDYEFVNVGGLPPSNVELSNMSRVLIGGDLPCSEDEAMGFCIATTGVSALVPSLESLDAGETLAVSFLFRGISTGDFDWSFSVDYDGNNTLPLTAGGEVVPVLPSGGAQATAGGRLKGTSGGEYTIDIMGPRLARGYGVDRLFHNIEDLDSINLFNGNLTVSLPIGPPQEVSQSLAYGLSLQYNSNVWDRQSKHYQDTQVFRPTTSTNVGAGWSLHLGRLCEPYDAYWFLNLSDEEKDKVFCRDSNWAYVSPDGRRHLFTGSGPNTAMTFDYSREEMDSLSFLYAVDGSYARLKRINTRKRELELADGTIHVFEKNNCPGSPCWNDSWDAWRLTAMKDRYGKQVTVTYTNVSGGMEWTLTDCRTSTNPCPGNETRTTIVKLDALSGLHYDYRVSSVELTGFKGARRTYQLEYSSLTVPRAWDGEWNPGGSFTVPVLARVKLPDHPTNPSSKYTFGYHTSGGYGGKKALRIKELETPTKGKISWDYSDLYMPIGGPCYDQRDSLDQTGMMGVASREILYEGGTEAKSATYLYGLYDGTAIASNYCDWDPTNPEDAPTPKAEAVTAVVEPIEWMSGNPTRHRVTLNYFSVFPVTIQGNLPLPGDGWTGAEFGLPLTRNQIHDDNPAGELYLSTQLYDVGTVTPVSHPKALVAGYSPLRSHYVKYGLAPKRWCDSAEACAPDNPRRLAGLDVFHDDGDQWRLVENKNNDGLGHFRRMETSADWDSRLKTEWTNWHPDAGTLFATFTSITDVTPPAIWVLGTSADAFVKVGSSPRLAWDDCWQASGEAMRLERTRRSAGPAPGIHDLIIEYSYDGQGRITGEDYYGGDLQTVGSNADLCAVSLPGPVYSRDYNYTTVTLSDTTRAERRTVAFTGVSHFESDLDVDLLSGLMAAQRDVGGRETTLEYDVLDRLSKSIHSSEATQAYAYVTGSTNKVTVTTHVRGDPTDVLTRGEMIYDDLGRVWVEREQLSNTEWSKSRINYNGAGRVKSVTTVQPDDTWSNAHAYKYEYDVLGRPVKLTLPDNSVTTMSYTSARVTSLTASVGTTFQSNGGAGTVSETNVTTTRTLDPFGRAVSVQTPLHTTSFTYNSADEVLTATRGTQVRSFGRDGRGFKTSETHPETGTVTYSSFDALGNVGMKTDGHADLDFEYDSAGRPIRVREASAGGRLLKRLFYYSSGNGKGQLSRAVRYQYLTPGEVGGIPGLDGQWEVSEEFTYDATGRVSGKELTVTEPSGDESAKFDQTWTYEDLGRVYEVGHPICLTASTECQGARRITTLDYTYGQLAGVSTADNMGADVAFHANGEIESIAHDDGSTSTFGVAANYLPRIASANLAGYNLGNHSYDGSGNLHSIGSQRYTYDGVGRLKEHYENGTLTDWYTYTGHDVLSHVNGSSLNVNGATNRLNGETYTGAGQQTTDTDSCRTQVWDALGDVRSSVWTDGCGQAAGWSALLYTTTGRRVLVGGSGGFQWEARDGGKLMATFDGSGIGLGLSKEYVYAGQTPLSNRDSAGTVSHLHADHLGTVRAITRDGSLLQRRYRPYGERVTASDHGEALGFAGHETDPRGDSLYMEARTYAWSSGRFYSPDPARTGWNLYAYASNNPINRVDTDGQDDEAAAMVESIEFDEEHVQSFIEIRDNLEAVVGIYTALYSGDEGEEVAVYGSLIGGFAAGVPEGIASLIVDPDSEAEIAGVIDRYKEIGLEPHLEKTIGAGRTLGNIVGRGRLAKAVGAPFLGFALYEAKHSIYNLGDGIVGMFKGDMDRMYSGFSKAQAPSPKMQLLGAMLLFPNDPRVIAILEKLAELARQAEECQSQPPEWQQNGAQKCK